MAATSIIKIMERGISLNLNEATVFLTSISFNNAAAKKKTIMFRRKYAGMKTLKVIPVVSAKRKR